MRSEAEYQRLFEKAEELREEAERQTHRANSFAADMLRVEELKDKVSALVWENDKLRDDAVAFKTELKHLRRLAIDVQQGRLVPAQGVPVPAPARAVVVPGSGYEGLVEENAPATQTVGYYRPIETE